MKLERLLFTGIYSLLIVSAVGTIAGTYAWFTYTSRLNTQFHGTSLSNSAHLKVGVVSDLDLSEAEQYGFVKDENNNIYWSKKGISAESLSYFLSASGYASEKLTPVTSGSYTLGGDFSLRKRPTFLVNSNSPADPLHYIYLPLAFKANTSDEENYNSFNVKLSNVSLLDKEEGTLASTIRINFLNQYSNENFLMNPNVIANGHDVVGGTLDFDLNGYNDNQGGYDFIYGEAETVVYNDTKSQGGPAKPREERNVFNGITNTGIYGINEEETVFKTCEYLGKEEVIAKKDVATANGELIAYATITIYEEGWSRTAIDRVTDNAFDLDLTFELYNEKNI